MGQYEKKLIQAREKVLRVAGQVPPNLEGDQKYAWMAKVMGMYAKPEGKISSYHTRLKVLNGFYGGFCLSAKRGFKKAAYSTSDAREERMYLCFGSLWKLGFKIEDPANLKSKHVDALVANMIEEGLSNSTIQNRLSALRVLCNWLGKKGVVKPTAAYATEENNLKRSGITSIDKSWSASDVDINEVIEKAIELDYVVGIQLIVMASFGLRVRETLMLDIWASHRGDQLFLTQGTKGGLGRAITIETDEQRSAIAIAKAFAQTRPHVHGLGWPGKSLKQALNHTHYILKKLGLTKKEFGVTAHGLRHEFCHSLMISRGLLPAVKGGEATQMEKADRKAVEIYASRSLGHSRAGITAAYAGSFFRTPVLPDAIDIPVPTATTPYCDQQNQIATFTYLPSKSKKAR